jgi:PEP-CTERM motif
MMKSVLLAATLLTTTTAAEATLQIAFTDGSTVVTCADGQACDLSSGANNIIILNETVGPFHIIGTVAASVSGRGDDNLQLSTSLIQNTGPSLGHLGIIVGDNNFVGPVSSIEESASLTFNSAVGSGASTLKFFADPANGQPGGVTLNVPGVQLFSTSGSPATDPDSFAGTNFSPFDAGGFFSMTETANLALRADGSITGFNESMAASSAIPEPSTWAMLGIGAGMMAWLGRRRRGVHFAF